MTSHRLAQVIAAIWTRLPARFRVLAVRPSVRGQGWRLCLRVVAVGVAAALMAAGLAAAPAYAAPVTATANPAPASAGSTNCLASAAGEAALAEAGVPGLTSISCGRATAPSATSSRNQPRSVPLERNRRSGSGSTAITTTALTTTATGTSATATPAATGPSPVVATFDFPGYPTAEMTAVMDNWWPESLGLADNSSLAQLLSGTWSKWNAAAPPSYWLPAQPANLSGATFAVTSDGSTGSDPTITAPLPSAITITSGSDPAWNPILAVFMAQIAGAATAAGAFAVCGAFLFGLPTNDSGWKPAFGAARTWTQVMCGGLSASVWGQVATKVGHYLTEGDTTTETAPWKSILGTAQHRRRIRRLVGQGRAVPHRTDRSWPGDPLLPA